MILLLDKSDQLPTSASNAVRPRGYGNIRGRSSLLQKRYSLGVFIALILESISVIRQKRCGKNIVSG